MVTKFAPLNLALCVASLRLIFCQTSFDDDYSVNDLDDYQIYERGYDTFEDDAIDQTYFDPYVGDYDDPYGDSLLQDLAVLKDCQIAADGSTTFNGASVLLPHLFAQDMTAQFLKPRQSQATPCRIEALRHSNLGSRQVCPRPGRRYGWCLQGVDL